MLGWNISVHRQNDAGASPATAESPMGTRLAVWQAGWRGLDWLNELAKAGKAVSLGGNGYPCKYTAPAKYLLPRIIEHPPEEQTPWCFEENDILLDGWLGKTVVDLAAVAECGPDEWLLVEAWDES